MRTPLNTTAGAADLRLQGNRTLAILSSANRQALSLEGSADNHPWEVPVAGHPSSVLARGVRLNWKASSPLHRQGPGRWPIIVYPESLYFVPEETSYRNTSLYGATQGESYFYGTAGDASRTEQRPRTVSRPGDHGCEYITAGRRRPREDGRISRRMSLHGFILNEDGNFRNAATGGWWNSEG